MKIKDEFKKNIDIQSSPFIVWVYPYIRDSENLIVNEVGAQTAIIDKCKLECSEVLDRKIIKETILKFINKQFKIMAKSLKYKDVITKSIMEDLDENLKKGKNDN